MRPEQTKPIREIIQARQVVALTILLAALLIGACTTTDNTNNQNQPQGNQSPTASPSPSRSTIPTGIEGDSDVIIKGGSSIEVSLNSRIFNCPPATEPPPNTPMRCVCEGCTLTGDVSIINGGSTSTCASGGGSRNVTVNGGDGGNGARDVLVQQTGSSVTVLIFPSQYKVMPGSPPGKINFHSNDAKMQGVTNGTTTCTGITQTTELHIGNNHVLTASPAASPSGSPRASTTP